MKAEAKRLWPILRGAAAEIENTGIETTAEHETGITEGQVGNVQKEATEVTALCESNTQPLDISVRSAGPDTKRKFDDIDQLDQDSSKKLAVRKTGK